MKLINYFLGCAVAATLYSCHSDNKPTSDRRLLFAAEIDEEEDDGISIVSSPYGCICLYSRNSTSKDYTYVVTMEDVPEVRTYHSDIPGQLGELYDTYTDN